MSRVFLAMVRFLKALSERGGRMLMSKTGAALSISLLAFVLGPGSGSGSAREPVPCVSAKVAVDSLLSLSDGYLQKMADALDQLADTAEVRSGDWGEIRGPLGQVARSNVEALNWFALPDGSYWSVQNGREQGNLSERSYFSEVLDGKTIIGEMLVSKATGRSVAIVAVPVMASNGKVVGVLGASIYLEKLSARLGREMGTTTPGMIYYSFDSKPLVGLNWDPTLVLTDPYQLGKDVGDAFRRMLAQDEGIESYVFRGHRRVVVYRRSELTGWWYVFGVVME